jgi:dipeptidyl-peptidase 4
VELATKQVTTLVTTESDAITYGLANFVAAEELDRYRGYWWSPDSAFLLVERADSTQVQSWWIADPANPGTTPHEHRYPAAGTPNPALELHIYDISTGASVQVTWDVQSFEYLVTAGWQTGHRPLITVMNRRQDRQLILEADPVTGATTTLFETTDPCWTEWISGLPAWSPVGDLIVHHDDLESDTRRISVVHEGTRQPLSPAGLQVQSVITMDDQGLVIAATPDSPFMEAHHLAWDGSASAVSATDDGGWYSLVTASAAPDALRVCARTSLNSLHTEFAVYLGDTKIGTLLSHAIGPDAAVPPVNPKATLHHIGPNQLRTIVIFPENHTMGSRKLPVVMCPYGGPHAVVAVAAGLSHARAQFLANQGFAVVISDGRGTPRRGPKWEREVFRDLAHGVLQDQVDAIQGVAELFPDDIDTARVGIRGWSFGGYLAALAVLERGDVFHAAVAGAPVTEWRLYDTGYTERYMGHPDTDKAAYDSCSLLPMAPNLSRPLLIIHGLADDNVVVAHALQLSGALLAAGKHHEFLALSGVTHMTPQEIISENLLKAEIEFFTTSLVAGH